MDRRTFVQQNYPLGLTAYLLSGNGFSVRYDRQRPNLANVWHRDVFGPLVDAGLMTRSKRGRYWWQT